jgi:hypothetical protein
MSKYHFCYYYSISCIIVFIGFKACYKQKYEQNNLFSMILSCFDIYLQCLNKITMENSTEKEIKPKKKSITRSASYPGISTKDAVDFSLRISQSFTKDDIISREDIAAVLGKSVSTITRSIAGAVQFGLFEKVKGGYRINSIVETIRNPISDIELKQCLLTAFGSPTLYKEIIEKFDNHAPPQEFKTILIRFHNISENVAEFVAESFIENAKYCGALDNNGIIRFANNANGEALPFVEVLDEEKENNETINLVPQGENTPTQNIIPAELPNGEEKLRIRLSEGKEAFLVHPRNINQKDIEILKKQIETLELSV